LTEHGGVIKPLLIGAPQAAPARAGPGGTAFALDLESKFELVAMFFKPVTIDWKLCANRTIESCRYTNLACNENKHYVVT